MNQVIIYKQDTGVVAIVRPTEEALAAHSIQAIAIKDVPAGKPFKIVDAADIPSDRTFREAWTVSVLELTDGIGGESNEFQD
jgi:hypothetical protein